MPRSRRDGTRRHAHAPHNRPMQYVVFTFDGYGLPIALQLQREGHQVVVAQVEDQADVLSELERNVPEEDAEEKRRRLSLYEGILDKRPARQVLKDLKPNKDTFLFFDLNHLFRFAAEAKALGLPGNYPTEA